MFKEYRLKNKLTQEKLAELLDIDSRNLQYIEAGTHLPSYNTLAKLVKILGITKDDLYKYITTSEFKKPRNKEKNTK